MIVAGLDASIPLSVQPPDAGAALKPISSLLAIRNGLQQYDMNSQVLQQQQLQTQQAQEVQNERGAVNSYLQDQGSYNPDGSLNMDKAMKTLPRIAPQIWSQYGSQAAEALTAASNFRVAHINATNRARDVVGGVLRAYVGPDGQPKADVGTITNALDSAAAQYSQAPDVANYAASVRDVLQHEKDPQALNRTLSTIADTSMGNGPLRQAQVGDTGMVSNGAVQFPVSRYGGVQPVGSAVGVVTPNQLGPDAATGVVTDPNGNPFQFVRDPGTGRITGVRPLASVPTPGGNGAMPYYGPGDRESVTALTAEGARNVAATHAAANDSPTRVNVLDNIINLASDPAMATGPQSDIMNKIKATLANTGMPDFEGLKGATGNYQELVKYLQRNAQYNFQAAGGTGTDNQLASIQAANPNASYNPQTIVKLAQYNKALELGIQAKASALDSWIEQNGGNLTKQRDFERQWRASFDPRVFQVQLMNPAEQAQFVNSLTPQEAQKFAQKRSQLRALGAFGNQ